MHIATSDPKRGYGFQWWTSKDGAFDAIGIHGQLIHIDPSRCLVVAINSAWPVAISKDLSAAREKMLRSIEAIIDAEVAR